MIGYFLFSNNGNGSKTQKDQYNFSYRNNLYAFQKLHMDRITKNMMRPSDVSEANRPDGVFVIHHYKHFTPRDVEVLKNNAKVDGWADVALPDEEGVVYASCNKNVAFNIYTEQDLKVAIYWYRYNNYCSKF